MSTFKVGDEVQCVKKNTYANKGTCGVIVAIDNEYGYLIKWNKDVGGFSDERYIIPYGRGEYMEENQIKKIIDFSQNKKLEAKPISASQKVKELEKALELLKDKKNYYIFVNENTETINVDYALTKAKEMLNEQN